MWADFGCFIDEDSHHHHQNQENDDDNDNDNDDDVDDDDNDDKSAAQDLQQSVERRPWQSQAKPNP